MITKSWGENEKCVETKMTSVSFNKITDLSVTASNSLEWFRLLDIPILQGLLTLLDCPECRKQALSLTQGSFGKKRSGFVYTSWMCKL